MTVLLDAVATLMRWFAVLIWTSATVVSLFFVLYLLFSHLGLWLGLASLPLFPMAVIYLPFHEAVTQGNWVIVITLYGGAFLGGSLYAFSRWLDPSRHFIDAC